MNLLQLRLIVCDDHHEDKGRQTTEKELKGPESRVHHGRIEIIAHALTPGTAADTQELRVTVNGSAKCKNDQGPENEVCRPP